ncbi:MAG: hypothetical protein SGPRY_004740, partial [Prymnesium sp.]
EAQKLGLSVITGVVPGESAEGAERSVIVRLLGRSKPNEMAGIRTEGARCLGRVFLAASDEASPGSVLREQRDFDLQSNLLKISHTLSNEAKMGGAVLEQRLQDADYARQSGEQEARDRGASVGWDAASGTRPPRKGQSRSRDLQGASSAVAVGRADTARLLLGRRAGASGATACAGPVWGRRQDHIEDDCNEDLAEHARHNLRPQLVVRRPHRVVRRFAGEERY